MKYYTDTILLPLAEKLKEKGMLSLLLVGTIMPTYAEVFDWLLSEKDMFIDVHPSWETGKVTYKSAALPDDINAEYYTFSADTWHEAAEKAIEKALTLI